jgi:hypothetical protein
MMMFLFKPSNLSAALTTQVARGWAAHPWGNRRSAYTLEVSRSRIKLHARQAQFNSRS